MLLLTRPSSHAIDPTHLLHHEQDVSVLSHITDLELQLLPFMSAAEPYCHYSYDVTNRLSWVPALCENMNKPQTL